MSLLGELLRESKTLTGQLEETKLTVGDTQLLRQTSRVLALAHECIQIMGKNKPSESFSAPSAMLPGHALYARDRQTTAATRTGYVAAFQGEKNIASKFVSNREVVQRKLVAQNARADKMTHIAKSSMLKLSSETEKFKRELKVAMNKVLVIQNDKKRLLKVCEGQEATIDEQVRIIAGLKYKLKRRWDTDPVIDISPRTRNIAKSVKRRSKLSKLQKEESKGKAIEENIKLAPVPPEKISEENVQGLIERTKCSLQRMFPCTFDKLETQTKATVLLQEALREGVERCEAVRIRFGQTARPERLLGTSVRDKDMVVVWPDDSTGAKRAMLFNKNCIQCAQFTFQLQPDAEVNTSQADKIILALGPLIESLFYSSRFAHASLDCFSIIKSQLSYPDLWQAIESTAKASYGVDDCKLYVVDSDLGQLVRFTRRTDDTIIETDGRNQKSGLVPLELRFRVDTGECIFGLPGTTYRGYATEVVKTGRAKIAWDSYEDEIQSAYEPFRATMVLPIFADNNTVLGCIEYMANFEFEPKIQAFATMFNSKIATIIITKTLTGRLKTQIKSNALLLEAIKPEILSNLNLPSLIETLTMKTKLVLDAERCVWFILDKDRGYLWSRLPHEGAMIKIKLDSKGIPGRVFQRQEAINIRNIKQHLENFSSLDDLDYYGIDDSLVSKEYMSIVGSVGSTLAVPMIAEDKSILGLVQVFNKNNSLTGFDAKDERNLEIMARHGCVAIQNASIFQGAHKSYSIGLDFSSNVQAVDVLEKVLQMLLKETHAEHAVIYMYQKGDTTMQIYNSRHNSKSVIKWTSVSTNCLAGHCALTRKSINLPDGAVRFDERLNKEVNRVVMGVKDEKVALEMNTASCFEPVCDQKGNVIAVMQVINKNKVCSARGVHSFDRMDIVRMNTIAKQAAISLRNALLQEGVLSTQKRMREMLQNSLMLTRVHQLDDLYSLVAAKTKEILECEESSVWLVSGKGDKHLRLHGEQSVAGDGQKDKHPITRNINEGVLGKTAALKDIVVINSSGNEQLTHDDVEHCAKSKHEINNAMCIPLISSQNNNVLGVVFVINKVGGHTFLDDDIECARTFCAQAAMTIENIRMGQHLSTLWQYSKSITPTANAFVCSLDSRGNLLHASHDPKYILGLEMEFMQENTYKKWLGVRNNVLVRHINDVYGTKSACTAHMTNTVYRNQHGQATIMNASVVPIFSVSMFLEGVVITMTEIKRHSAMKILEGRLRKGLKRVPWADNHRFPYRHVFNGFEPSEEVFVGPSTIERLKFSPEICLLAICLDVSTENASPLDKSHSFPEYVENSKAKNIIRDIKRSTFSLKPRNLDLNVGDMALESPLTAQDFLGKLMFDVHVLINESGGTVDRTFDTNTVIAVFGIKDGDSNPKAFAERAANAALKITDLVRAFQEQWTAYYELHYSSSNINPIIRVAVGIHTSVAPKTVPVDSENGKKEEVGEAQEEDAPQIFQLMEEDLDLAVEMAVEATRLGVERVLTPHASLCFRKVLEPSALQFRKIATSVSQTLNSSLELHELVRYENLGAVGPEVSRSIKYFEQGLDAFESNQINAALSRFLQALALWKDSITQGYVDKCRDLLKR